MRNYLTMSRLVLTEGLGSQMGNFAAMYAITRVTGHRILFPGQLDRRKRVVAEFPFEGLPIDLVSEKSMTLEERTAHTFDLDTECVGSIPGYSNSIPISTLRFQRPLQFLPLLVSTRARKY